MAFLLALGSAALYGAADFLGGLGSRRASTLVIVVSSQGAGLVLLLLILPLLPAASPATTDLTWGGAAGLAGGIGVALLYRALAVGTMAVVAPTTAVCAVMIPVMAGVLAGERLAGMTIAGILLAMVAIVLVSRETVSSREPDKVRATGNRAVAPGIGIALASGVAIGFFFLALARTDSAAGMWPLVAARIMSVALFAAAVVASRTPPRMSAGVTKIAVGAGIVDMAANALYLLATRYAALSVVVTLSSLYPASTVILARVVLGERLNRWQMAGVSCALAAIALIVSGERATV